MHPEDIKAALRKRFGSVSAFEDAHDLPRKSVSDVLRGRPNQRVKDTISKVISPDSKNGDMPPQSELSDCIKLGRAAHRQNSGAK